MSKTQETDITRKPVVYSIPGMELVRVRRDVIYKVTDTNNLTFDIYLPDEPKSTSPVPAVLFVLGYSDTGFEKVLGCKQKEMASYVSWGRLIASSGMAAIAYSTTSPPTDALDIISYLRQNSTSLGVDKNRISVWAFSGNAPTAMWVLMQQNLADFSCAVFCYGYGLDDEDQSLVSEGSETFGFANPTAGKSANDLPQKTPMLIIRAGQDECPGLNASLDRLVLNSLACNLPVSLVNLPEAPHAFDLIKDTVSSREAIHQILEFTSRNMFRVV